MTANTLSHPPVYKDLLSFAFDDRPVDYEEQRPIFIDAENPSWALNAKQFRNLVRLLIAGLKAKGLQRGQCVLVHLPNNVLYSAIFYGIIGAGGVYFGANQRSQPLELDHLVKVTEPKIIVTSPEGLPTLRQIANLSSRICVLEETSISKLAQFLSSRPSTPVETTKGTVDFGESTFTFASLLDHGEADWIRFDDKCLAESTPAAMYSTSGTGGLPKAGILSHHAVVTQHLNINYYPPYDVTRLISLPMFHLFGALWSHIFPIRYGQPLYILPRFDIEQYARTIYIYRITETYMVPAMIQLLNKCSCFALSEYLASLRYIGIAGASIDAASVLRLRQKLRPDSQVSQLWGMTEVGVAFQCRYGVCDDAGSIGPIIGSYEARLVDDDGHNIAMDNQQGELYIRGPATFMGYRGNPDAETKDENGWFRTGDIMQVMKGKFYFVGRSKELIKVNGWQVAPAEIESVLLKHPSIADAAVIGVPQYSPSSPRVVINETVRAFVVRNKMTVLTEEEVYLFAKGQLASYKAINGGVVFVENIPRTPAGKIQRFKLAQMNSYREIVSTLLKAGDKVGEAAGVVSANTPKLGMQIQMTS